ncbi:hypothetical protein [Luteolibacter pohnpeiensis]|uniref:hypothetical protein n=1 Tax=Luteolibacter pohnpeiensis TaxID=454153 RepID=UPI001904D646|nr:hypothetical protein [Luteolibacter pohnpeiensis]
MLPIPQYPPNAVIGVRKSIDTSSIELLFPKPRKPSWVMAVNGPSPKLSGPNLPEIQIARLEPVTVPAPPRIETVPGVESVKKPVGKSSQLSEEVPLNGWTDWIEVTVAAVSGPLINRKLANGKMIEFVFISLGRTFNVQARALARCL